MKEIIDIMKQIDFNSYLGYCWGTLIVLVVFLNKFQYEEETKTLMIGTIGILAFLPFEMVCGKIVWNLIRKIDFEIKFLFSNRIVKIT